MQFSSTTHPALVTASDRISNGNGQAADKLLQEKQKKRKRTAGASPRFEYERLLMFTRNELSTSLAIPMLAVVVAIALVYWVPVNQLLIWLAAVFIAKGIVLTLCRLFEKTPRAEADVTVWRRKLGAAEFFYGVTWAGIAFVDITTQQEAAFFFIFASLIIVIAVRTMFASTVMPLLHPGTIPLTAALVLRFALVNHPFYWALAVVAIGVHVYFIYLAKGLNTTLLSMLEYRAEKDALIAELEQSKAVSDDARRRAESANLAKSRFLATMSHELRTPLNAILGFSEVMKEEVLGPHSNPTYRNYAADIHESGKHLLHLINEILDLSRIEAGRYQLSESVFQFSEVVEDCHRLLKLRAEEKGLRIVETFERGMPQLWADERAVRQICLNLLSNAIKFTPEGGVVTLKVGMTRNGEAYLTVADNGPGIPEEEIPIVLRSFGQGSFARTSAEGGTGLGLPIVKGLIELHGGRFELKSKVGEGTSVTVIFPRERLIDAPRHSVSSPTMTNSATRHVH